MKKSARGLWVLVAAFGATMSATSVKTAGAQAAGAPAYPFPLTTDSVAADPSHYKILFEDARVRFVEVTLQPGETEKMHGNPYPAVIAIDGAQATSTRALQDPEASKKNIPGRAARPPVGTSYPYCKTDGPEAPFATTNTDSFPLHFYRIEYKRQDWPDLPYKWKEWYPWIAAPEKPATELDPKADLGPPFSDKFPFPVAYDSVKASPNNHFLRHEDDHIRFIEVVIRPGETELMHGHPYSSVFARDGVPMGAPPPPRPANTPPPTPPPAGTNAGGVLVPGSPFNSPIGGYAYAAEGFEGPSCTTMDPEAPHKVHNPANWPDHFYRLEYRRLDGDDIKTKGSQWYPAPVKSAASN